MTFMPKLIPLPRSFFARPTLTVARQLLGKQLVKVEKGQRLVGAITEVEAYVGEGDLACHAKAGRTSRTAIMYGPAGHLYVYFTYGMHWMLNVITEGEDFPAAILLRAIELTEGEAIAQDRRGRPDHLTDGPAKLAQALAIDGTWNGIDLCAPRSALFVADGATVPARKIKATPRVGIGSTPEPWLSLPWNFSNTPI
jgi:DNA-3-methyladenine glycosylase